MGKFVTIFLVTAAHLIMGCQSPGILLKETPLNISETRKVISSIIGQPRSVSENGRELISHYYDVKNKTLDQAELPTRRFYTRVEILGDRRPYDIEVDVLVEKRDQGKEYFVEGHDSRKAASLAEKLEKALHQGRDSRNVIDDFRSF